MLHTDIPTPQEILDLLTSRTRHSVSIYLPTSPVPNESEANQLAFRDLAERAMGQLREQAEDRDDRLALDAVEAQLADLQNDRAFWQHLSHTLAVFATPESIRSFRLPNRLSALAEAADRFYVKPLLRAVTFPQSAFVLALSQNAVRLVQVTSDAPATSVEVPNLPTNAVEAVGVDSISGRGPDGRLRGSEGQKVRLRQYAREVDRALRPVLAGSNLPLILAAAEPLESIYRSVNTFPGLHSQTLAGNPEAASDADLAQGARPLLDEHYRAELAALRERFGEFIPAGRALTDLSDIARAATHGAVDTLLVDIDRHLAGTVDEQTGAIQVADDPDATTYGVVDEVVRRVLLSGGRVYAVRAEDLPSQQSQVAAILRFAPAV